MSILKDLGRVSAETKGTASGAIGADASPSPTSYSTPRFCSQSSVCKEIFQTNGVTNVDANYFSAFGPGHTNACLTQDLKTLVVCK
jgi:hypothetical protein